MQEDEEGKAPSVPVYFESAGIFLKQALLVSNSLNTKQKTMKTVNYLPEGATTLT